MCPVFGREIQGSFSFPLFFVHHSVVCSAHNSIRIRVFALVEFQVSFIKQKPIRAWNLTSVLCHIELELMEAKVNVNLPVFTEGLGPVINLANNSFKPIKWIRCTLRSTKSSMLDNVTSKKWQQSCCCHCCWSETVTSFLDWSLPWQSSILNKLQLET